LVNDELRQHRVFVDSGCSVDMAVGFHVDAPFRRGQLAHLVPQLLETGLVMQIGLGYGSDLAGGVEGADLLAEYDGVAGAAF
jgi:hypothetical protein